MSKPKHGTRARSKSASPRSKRSARPPLPSGGSFPGDWLAFIDCLVSNEVRFLIVGGHALAAHGRPRFTEDLDIFVEPTHANARRVAQAFAAFGFPALATEVAAFATRERMATLGRKPLRIDVMTSISGVGFREAWRDRLVGVLAGRDVAYLGREALIRNKAASARPKDLADLALLAEGRSGRR